jgi:ubiquinone/menaquinone biosynthesis C-methylase UbiE
MPRMNTESEPLTNLAQALQEEAPAEALRAFCEQYGCALNAQSMNGRFLLSFKAGDHVLDMGAGVGEDAAAFTEKGARVTALVPTEQNARLVSHYLAYRGGSGVEVLTAADPCRLPVDDGSLDGLLLEDAATGFVLNSKNFETAVREWCRVLKPSGQVFLGLTQPICSAPLFKGLYRRMRARGDQPSLNQFVKTRAGTGSSRLSPGRAARLLRKHGFEMVSDTAPLPSEHAPDILVPLNSPETIDYFLTHLIRRNSAWVRLAVAGARIAARLRLFPYFVPYRYLLFKSTAGP